MSVPVLHFARRIARLALLLVLLCALVWCVHGSVKRRCASRRQAASVTARNL